MVRIFSLYNNMNGIHSCPIAATQPGDREGSMSTIATVFFALITPFWVAWFSYETVRLRREARAYAPKKAPRR